MNVGPVGILASNQTENQAASSRFSENFDDFLKLLTTQMENQNPLEPLDGTEFTTQLVQFSSVEQQIAQNQRLDQLLALQQSNVVTNAVGFIGKTIEAAGNQVDLKNGQATIGYGLAKDAEAVTITIRNSSGEVVRSIQGAAKEGQHSFTWDGKNTQGIDEPPGSYSFAVTALDAEGATHTIDTTIRGIVDSVTAEDGVMVLKVGEASVALKEVLSVYDEPQPTTES